MSHLLLGILGGVALSLFFSFGPAFFSQIRSKLERCADCGDFVVDIAQYTNRWLVDISEQPNSDYNRRRRSSGVWVVHYVFENQAHHRVEIERQIWLCDDSSSATLCCIHTRVAAEFSESVDMDLLVFGGDPATLCRQFDNTGTALSVFWRSAFGHLAYGHIEMQTCIAASAYNHLPFPERFQQVCGMYFDRFCNFHGSLVVVWI